MSIRAKLVVPLVILAIFLGSTGYIVITQQFDELRSSFVSLFVKAKIAEARSSVDTLADSALKQAATFSRMPAVVEAFELANAGDMNDENDAQVQAARELLREKLAPVLQGYEKSIGGKLRIHFHLPTARSFVRMWRSKQAKRGGEWVDVSDDLSSFRETVLTVNKTRQPVQGIEPGRGGFTIRGLAPVVGADGRHLGSVEVLIGFSQVLQTLEEEEGTAALLYMNHNKLAITTKLQNPEKYPVVDGQYVLIHGLENVKKYDMINTELLNQARQAEVMHIYDNVALGAFPVRDYKGEVIGVAVLAQDITTQQSILSGVLLLIAIGLALVVILPLGLTLWVFQRAVVKPVALLSEATAKVSTGNLDCQVDIRAKDEIGSLGMSVNTMVEDLRQKATLAKTIAEGDLTCDVQIASSEDVLGKALREMTDSLNSLLGQVRESAQDVDNASHQVSDSSFALSEGATKQAASLEEITSSLTEVASQTKENAANAGTANDKATSVSSSVEQGRKDMTAMVAAMSEVSDSSQAIAKIIKVIDEIAFQTNLLALNAAVEAARAGRHGKGFAVVAEEVRNLSGRSAKAAQETAELIDASMNKVAHTNEMVELAASSLEAVVEDVTTMSSLVGAISEASSEQALALAEIAEGLHQVDQVTQDSTASAEETSAAAQQLSSQAAKLNELAQRFRLKNARVVGAHTGVAPAKTTVTTPRPQPLQGASTGLPSAPGADAQAGAWGSAAPTPGEIISLDDDEFGKY